MQKVSRTLPMAPELKNVWKAKEKSQLDLYWLQLYLNFVTVDWLCTQTKLYQLVVRLLQSSQQKKGNFAFQKLEGSWPLPKLQFSFIIWGLFANGGGIKTQITITSLVTLFGCKLQGFKNSPKWTVFGILSELLSTQNGIVVRLQNCIVSLRRLWVCVFVTPNSGVQIAKWQKSRSNIDSFYLMYFACIICISQEIQQMM